MSLIRCRLLIEKESCVHESMNRNIKQNKKAMEWEGGGGQFLERIRGRSQGILVTLCHCDKITCPNIIYERVYFA